MLLLKHTSRPPYMSAAATGCKRAKAAEPQLAASVVVPEYECTLHCDRAVKKTPKKPPENRLERLHQPHRRTNSEGAGFIAGVCCVGVAWHAQKSLGV